MLSSDLALALDPARVFDRLAMLADPWQVDLLRKRPQRALLNVTRQGGKSETSAVAAVHEAIYYAPALVLLLSPSLRQSGELFKKVMAVYNALGQPVPAETSTALHLKLSNGSRIVSLPGKEATIRGYSAVDLLVVDEASRVPDELYMAVRPMLAVSGGRLIAPSTPFGKRGWWHAEWTGGNEWERVEVPATACPRISEEFLREERAAMGEWWYRQEYLCQFSDTVDQVFGYDLVAGAMNDEITPLFEVA